LYPPKTGCPKARRVGRAFDPSSSKAILPGLRGLSCPAEHHSGAMGGMARNGVAWDDALEPSGLLVDQGIRIDPGAKHVGFVRIAFCTSWSNCASVFAFGCIAVSDFLPIPSPLLVTTVEAADYL
jgi:hypothetical protein